MPVTCTLTRLAVVECGTNVSLQYPSLMINLKLCPLRSLTHVAVTYLLLTSRNHILTPLRSETNCSLWRTTGFCHSFQILGALYATSVISSKSLVSIQTLSKACLLHPTSNNKPEVPSSCGLATSGFRLIPGTGELS